MSVGLILLLVAALAVYWIATQIVPERKRMSLVRRSLGDGFLERINEKRHAQGLPLLEFDEELAQVAENKAVHQVLTGESADGWDYPPSYQRMLGRSLLMEALVMGPVDAIPRKLVRQHDLFEDEWVRCGIGAAGTGSGQVAVAIILCREAWEPVVETSPRLAESRT